MTYLRLPFFLHTQAHSIVGREHNSGINKHLSFGGFNRNGMLQFTFYLHDRPLTVYVQHFKPHFTCRLIWCEQRAVLKQYNYDFDSLIVRGKLAVHATMTIKKGYALLGDWNE